jgi:hypothetical protein
MFVAEHRNTLCIEMFDVLQVTRCLLSENFPLMPVEQYVDTLEAGDWKALDTAYLWDGGSESKRPDLRSQLAHCDPNRTNGHVSFLKKVFKFIQIPGPLVYFPLHYLSK